MYKKALFSLGNQRSGRPFVVDTEVNNSFVTSMTIIDMHETFHFVQTVYQCVYSIEQLGWEFADERGTKCGRNNCSHIPRPFERNGQVVESEW